MNTDISYEEWQQLGWGATPFGKGTWELVVGLEVHAQIKSRSKLISAASTGFGAPPNTQVSFTDAGLPGMLPLINRRCIVQALKASWALKGCVSEISVFDRKHYFYPDLPLGYQITQFFKPIMQNGHMNISTSQGEKMIRINRLHIEADAGKSVHDVYPTLTAIDLNRAGVGLMEIVSEADFRTPEEVLVYVKKLHHLLVFIGSCEGIMAHGHFRMDVNVSIHQPHEPWGMRVEIKNLNSFFAVEQALNYEIWRQWVHCASGQRVVQETRLFDDKKGVTQTMRSKENAVDYFYFPDPDLLPVFLTSDLQEEARSEMPPLPDESLLRMINHGGLKLEEAQLIVVHPTYVQLFFSCLNHLEHLCPNEMLQRLGKMVCNWIIGEVFAAQKKEMSQGKGFELLESEIEHQKLPDPIKLAEILSYVIFEKISHPAAKKVFLALNIQESVKDIIQRLKVEQIVDFETLHAFAAKVVEDNPIQVEQYQQKDSFGKEKLFEFFVGKVMGLSQGRAHPEKIRQYLYDFLSKI